MGQDDEGQYQLIAILTESPTLDGTKNRDEISEKVEGLLLGALGPEAVADLADAPILVTDLDNMSARDYAYSLSLDLNLLSSSAQDAT